MKITRVRHGGHYAEFPSHRHHDKKMGPGNLLPVTRMESRSVCLYHHDDFKLQNRGPGFQNLNSKFPETLLHAAYQSVRRLRVNGAAVRLGHGPVRHLLFSYGMNFKFYYIKAHCNQFA